MTRAASYAIHALVHMANRKDNRPLPSHLTAQEEGIPERFLLKVLKPLVSRGVLRSVKGPNGGYQLAKTPKDITLLEIIEAVDGPIQANISFEGKNTAGLEKQLQTICTQAADAVRKQFQKVRLSELAGK
jgi:Rrf2 family protein